MFTQGRSPFRYLRPLRRAPVPLGQRRGRARGAGRRLPGRARADRIRARPAPTIPNEVRIAFDGDAVLFSDEAERVFQAEGLDAFQQHEIEQGAAAAARRSVQAAARGAAPAAAGGHAGHADPHRAGDGAQRAGARARDPHADGLEHPRRRGDVPRRPAQGRVPARVRARLLLRRPDRPRRPRRAPRARGPRVQRHHRTLRTACRQAGRATMGLALPEGPRMDVPHKLAATACHGAPQSGRSPRRTSARRRNGRRAACSRRSCCSTWRRCTCSVQINEWNRVFYDALQDARPAVFWHAGRRVHATRLRATS